MERLVFLLYRAFAGLMAWLPLELTFRLGTAAGALAWLVAGRYRRLILRNLRIAFPDKSPGELRATGRAHCRLLGGNLFASFKAATMSQNSLERRVKVENLDIIHAAFAEGRGIVLVLSHIGNWELTAQLAHLLPGHSLAAIYRPLGNRLVDAHVRETRGHRGVRPLSRRQGFTTAVRILRENGLVGVLVDQHAGDGGVWAPLFGRLASTTPLAATLAARTGAILVPVAVHTDGPARWRVVVSPPIKTDGDNVETLTAAINLALENQIRVNPPDWFWVHDRWKTPAPSFLLTRQKRGVAFARDFDRRGLQPFRILVRSSNWLGDAVMSVPAVRAIKNGRPDAHVTVLTKEKLAAFWKAVPEVDDVLTLAAGGSLFHTAAQVRGKFEAAVVFPNSIRSALEVFLGAVPRRIGYRGKWRSAFLNQILDPRPPKQPGPEPHQVFHYLKLAQLIGAPVTAPDFPSAIPRPGRSSTGTETLGLCPGAEYGPAKRWPADRFLATARQVIERRDVTWKLFGTAGDSEAGDLIGEGLGDRCENRVGKTSLAELITELSECRLLLTNDTGTMHLAGYLGVPVVAIFGSTEPTLTGPLGDGHRVLRRHVSCSPCFLRKCPIDFRCMLEVEVDHAVEAILRSLENEPPDTTVQPHARDQ